MKALFWLGLAVVVLGIVSLFVPIPHNEEHGIKAGGVSIGVETESKQTVSPFISAALILGGAVLMIAGKRAVIVKLR